MKGRGLGCLGGRKTRGGRTNSPPRSVQSIEGKFHYGLLRARSRLRGWAGRDACQKIVAILLFRGGLAAAGLLLPSSVGGGQRVRADRGAHGGRPATDERGSRTRVLPPPHSRRWGVVYACLERRSSLWPWSGHQAETAPGRRAIFRRGLGRKQASGGDARRAIANSHRISHPLEKA